MQFSRKNLVYCGFVGFLLLLGACIYGYRAYASIVNKKIGAQYFLCLSSVEQGGEDRDCFTACQQSLSFLKEKDKCEKTKIELEEFFN